MKNEHLIDQLSAELRPVKVLPSYMGRALAWSLFCNFFVVLMTALTGPFRENFFDQLTTSPQFLTQFLIGILVNPIACVSLFYLIIPGKNSFDTKRFAISILPFVLLLLLALLSTLHPALPPAMIGKREFCTEQTILFGLIPFFSLWFAVSKSYPWHKYWVGIYLSIAAFTPGAIIMHIACMYDPWHILKWHLFPLLVLSVIGVSIANHFLIKKN